eukprot:TRINITY_DN651_c0_g1_i5.p1 TRINITY_DN651_c0_g1~~TRINITY_DN651_c0_g1_i5.p1  ORF type:complete len:1553 (+),score=547.04 TRINITY_DN651_c0_g1_i5:66-4724(+)
MCIRDRDKDPRKKADLDSDDEPKKKGAKDAKKKPEPDSDDEPKKKKQDGKKEEKKADPKDKKGAKKDEDSEVEDKKKGAKGKDAKKRDTEDSDDDPKKKTRGKSTDKKKPADDDSDEDPKKKSSGKTTDRKKGKAKDNESSDEDERTKKDPKKSLQRKDSRRSVDNDSDDDPKRKSNGKSTDPDKSKSKGRKEADSSSEEEKGGKGSKKAVKDKKDPKSKRNQSVESSSDDERDKRGSKSKRGKGTRESSSDDSDDEGRRKKKKKNKLFPTGLDDFDEFEDEEPEKPVVPHFHEDYFQRKMKLLEGASLEKAKKVIDRTEEMLAGRILERSVKFSDEKKMNQLIRDFEFPDYDRRALNSLYYSGLVADLKPSKLEKAGFATMTAKHNVLKGILLGEINIGPVKKNLDELIFEVKFPQYEEEMKKAKLKEYERKQRELKEKLEEMNVNIDLLKYEEEHFFADKDGKPMKRPKEWTQKQAEDFVKKVQKERIDLARKRRSRFQKRQAEIAEIEEEEERKKQEELEEKNEERREELRRQRKELKQKKKAWKKELERWEEDYQEKLENLYHFPEDKLKEFDEAERERMEERLEEIRDHHKPLDYEELREWERDYMEKVNERRKKMEEERAERPAVSWVDSKKAGAFESGFLGYFKEEQNKVKAQEKMKFTQAREAMERRKDFASKVKSSFLPGIDEMKRLALRKSIERLDAKGSKKKRKKRERSQSAEGSRSGEGKESRSESEEPDPRKIGNDYLKAAREMARKAREAQGEVTQSLNITGREDGYESSQTGLKKRLNASKHDYLTDMRKQHEFRTPQQSEWERIARKSDMSEKDKRLMVRLQAEKMEEAARMRELYIRNNKKLADDKKIEELDEMYLTSIKAKLALLQNDPLGEHSLGGGGLFGDRRGRNGIEGTLQIVILKGINLKDMDFAGKSDAFAIALLGGKEVGRTQVIESSSPEWKKTIVAPVNLVGETTLPKLKIEVRDEDVGSDDLIGTVELDLAQCLREPGLWAINDELPLSSGNNAKGSTGRIQVQVAFMPKLNNSKDAKGGRPIKLPELIEGTLNLTIGKGVNIKSMDTFGKSDAFVVAMFGEKEIARTKVIASSNPEWNEQFSYEVSFEEGKIPPFKLEVRDEDNGSDDLIGVINVDFMKLVRNPFVTALNEMATVFDPKTKANNGQVQIQASFMPKKGKNVQDGVKLDRKGTIAKTRDDDLMKSEGTITVVIGKGTKIKSMDTFAKSDAFCKILLGTAEIAATKVITSADPDWNETFSHVFTYELTAIPKLRVEVWDKDTLSNDFIGGFDLDLTKCIRNAGMWAINEVFDVIDPKKPKEVNGKVAVQASYTAKGKQPLQPGETSPDARKKTMVMDSSNIPKQSTIIQQQQQQSQEDVRKSQKGPVRTEVEPKPPQRAPKMVNGQLNIMIVKAEGLKKADTFGLSDAFTTIKLQGKEVGKTGVITSLSPVWKAPFNIPLSYEEGNPPTLEFIVLDQDTFGSDKLGELVLSVKDIVRSAGFFSVNGFFDLLDPETKKTGKSGKIYLQIAFVPQGSTAKLSWPAAP